MQRRIRRVVPIALIVLLTVVVFEIVGPRLLFHFFSMPFAVPFMGDGLPLLVQSSKRDVKPQDYVAIAGDSVAFGLGDWLHQEMGNINTAYSTAHLLHKSSGRDVVNFSSSGAGSVRAIVTEPVATLEYLNSSLLNHVDDPDVLIVYFYEGNDLNDNVEYFRRAAKHRRALDWSKLGSCEYLKPWIDDVALQQDELYQKAKAPNFFDSLYFWRFITEVTKALISAGLGKMSDIFGGNSGESTIASEVERSPYNYPGRFGWEEDSRVNRALIGNQAVAIPDLLQGPSMDLSEREVDDALNALNCSLELAAEWFTETRIGVLYVPSVISSYAIASDQVRLQAHTHKEKNTFPTPAVLQKSEWLREQVKYIANTQNVFFYDATPEVRQASKTDLIHGPLDWNHFNQLGYQALGRAVADMLNQMSQSTE